MIEHTSKIQLFYDLTYEWVAAYLAEFYKIPVNRINSKPLGIFSRYVRRDIEDIRVAKVEGEQNLFFQLNREGFYDALPEYLFHQARDHRFFKNSDSSILGEIQRGREIEESVRNFFQVFEEEFLRSSLRVQQYENGILKIDFGLLKNKLLEWFVPFDVTDFTEEQQTKLLIYLPTVHQNLGVRNLDYYTELVDYFFGYKAQISYLREPHELRMDHISGGLGSQSLSWDFSLGNKILIPKEVLVATLFPKKTEDFKQLICDTNLDQRIKKIFDWVLPYNIDFRLKKEIMPGCMKGVKIGKDEVSYLGYVRS